jgi:hypothetical protein
MLNVGDKVVVAISETVGTIVRIRGCYATVETWSNATREPKLMRLEFKLKFLERVK